MCLLRFNSSYRQGIISQRSCPSTLQPNGVAVHKNCMIRALLIESSEPSRFWYKALSTAVHPINRLLSPTLNNVSPFYKLFHQHLTYSHL